MDELKSCPRILLQRLFFTIAVGSGCMIVGAAYFFFGRDTIFLFLSIAILVGTAVKGVGIYFIIKEKKYDVVEGVCISVSEKPLSRYRKVKLINEDGSESSVLLGKQARVKIGSRYRFYFKQNRQPLLGSEYLDTALSSDYFLGIEELGEY